MNDTQTVTKVFPNLTPEQVHLIDANDDALIFAIKGEEGSFIINRDYTDLKVEILDVLYPNWKEGEIYCEAFIEEQKRLLTKDDAKNFIVANKSTNRIEVENE